MDAGRRQRRERRIDQAVRGKAGESAFTTTDKKIDALRQVMARALDDYAEAQRTVTALIRVEEGLADARKTTRYAERRLAHEMAPYRTGFTVNSPSIDAALDALRQ